MRNCRVWEIDSEIEIYRNEKDDFNPEPTTLPYVLSLQYHYNQEFRKNCAEWGDYPAVVSKDDVTYSYKQYYEESMKQFHSHDILQ